MKLCKDEAREYGRRGGKARQQEYRYLVEGSYASANEIAARVGISRTTVLKRIRQSEGPLTWELFRKSSR